MIRIVIRRLVVACFQLLGISLITFLLLQLSPGSFFDKMKLDPQISPETLEAQMRLFNLDKPVLHQYLSWIRNLFHGELGYSFFYKIPVKTLIGSRLWNTFLLSFSAFLFTWLLAIPLGIWAAVYRYRWVDRLIQTASYVALSTPSFFLAMLLLYAFSVWGGLPLGGMRSAAYEDLSLWGKGVDIARHLIIPTLAISLASIGSLQRIMRGNMLEVLGQQYILTARAKGLPENRVIYRHALRNAINPLITLLGFEFAALLSGAALVEIICSWPGLGSLLLTATRSKDLYLVMASVMMGGVLFLLGNLMADLLLPLADPRIRYDRHGQ